MTTAAIIFLIYLIVGPLAWLALSSAMWMGRHRMDKMAARSELHPQQTAPRVTVLVPAKDEAQRIGDCIASILAQDYPNFEIVAINDRSSDGTAAVLDAIAQREPRLRVIHISQGGLPAGWLGKCHALHVGAKEARGEWLLFVDSDVTLQPHALTTALTQAAARGYGALSLLTRLECHRFLERLFLPLAAAAWSVMHTISYTNEGRYKQHAFANGQFFLIRRDAYEHVGGHASVRNQITEDVELMRLLKGAGYQTRFFSGDHLAATRMHATLRQMFNGWGRIYSGSARRRPWRILAAVTFLLISSFSAYAAIAWGLYALLALGDAGWLIAGSVHVAVMTVQMALIYHWSGNPLRSALLFPLAASLLLAVFAFALRLCWTGRVNWRGTHYDAKQMHQPG